MIVNLFILSRSILSSCIVFSYSLEVVQEETFISVSLDSSEVRSDDRVTLCVLKSQNGNLIVISNALNHVTIISSVYSNLTLVREISRSNVECLVDGIVATSTSILSVEADELIVSSILSHLSVSRIQEIGSSQVGSICNSSTLLRSIFTKVAIGIYSINCPRIEIVCGEVECLNTLIVELWAEYQALQMSEESNHNGILLSALHIVEVQIVFGLHSSDCAIREERNLILFSFCCILLILLCFGIVGVSVELASLSIGNIVVTVLAVNTVFTVLAVNTVFTVLAVNTIFAISTVFTIFANSFVIGLRSVLIPKTVITDSPGVTIFAISTVFTIGNLEIAAIAGEDLHTISDRLHICEIVAFTDGVVNLTDCLGKIVDLFL